MATIFFLNCSRQLIEMSGGLSCSTLIEKEEEDFCYAYWRTGGVFPAVRLS